MAKHVNLTNEKLTDLFDNPFDLVNHAISMAQQVIASGKELGDSTDQNSATQILKRVLKERQAEVQSEKILEQGKNSSTTDKDLPDPLLQAI